MGGFSGLRASAKNKCARSRRILVRVQGASVSAYLWICAVGCNAVDGPKDKPDCVFIFCRGPYRALKDYRAINSVGECHPHTVEVRGSNPRSPTTLKLRGISQIGGSLFSWKLGQNPSQILANRIKNSGWCALNAQRRSGFCYVTSSPCSGRKIGIPTFFMYFSRFQEN